MIPAEFEERAYEAPLCSQLQREDPRLFNPGQVLENSLGFDRGLFVAQKAIWKILGLKGALRGAVLSDFHWPGKHRLQEQLPQFRLNLFLQAKRPYYCHRKPRSLREMPSVAAPLWAFRIKRDQQRLLEDLADKTKGSSHVAYAAGTFHTYSALFAHTERETIVKNSTFPSVAALKDHDCWYYQKPGAEGVANPNPEFIQEPPLLPRLLQAATPSVVNEGHNLGWMERLADAVTESARFSEGSYAARSTQFFRDLQTLESVAPRFQLQPGIRSYVQIQLFATRFELDWLVLEGRS